MPAIWISVVGRCEIHLGRSRIKPESAVFFGLLLYLGLRPGVRVTREELLELLWPGAPEQARRHSLRQLLYRIRRAEVPLELDGPEVVLDGANVHSDLAALFDGTWADTVAVEDVPSPLSLFAGYRPSLGPAFAAWVDGVREDACVAIRKACTRHISEGRREGRWPDVEAIARICIACDPLNESAHMALAEALAMTGSKAEALRVLDEFFWEAREGGGQPGREAQLLRNRIAAQPDFYFHRLGEPALIGRGDEMGWLNRRRDAVKAGVPGASFLIGGAGIGKSALVRTFSINAELSGWCVITTRLRPGDSARPMSALFELIPQLLRANGALGAAPEAIAQLRGLVDGNDAADGEPEAPYRAHEADAARARVRAAALDLLAAVVEEAPLILVVEDVHWIDSASLHFLSWLIDSTDSLHVMWLMTARPEARFDDVRECLPPERHPARTVGPLSAVDSAALFRAFGESATSVAAVDDSTHSAAGGNPLYIREIALHWVETKGNAGLPNSLRALMSERVGRLSPTAQRVLYGSAILGRFATVSRVSELMAVSPLQMLQHVDALDQLGVLGVTRARGTLGLHDLWQEHLLECMPQGTKAVMHVRAGDLLAGESAIQPTPAMVTDAAWHYVEAGAPTKALGLLNDAASHLLQNGFTEDAVDASRQAWEYAKLLGDNGKARQLYLDCLFQAGHWHSILTVTSSSESLGMRWPASHSDEELLAIEALWRTGSDPAAVRRAIQCAESHDAPRLHRLRACLLTARAAANSFDPELMSRAKSAARILCQRKDANDTVAMTLSLVIETESGDVAAAAKLADELIAHERRANNIDGLARALRFACYPYRACGAWNHVLGLAGESFAIAEKCQLAEHGAMAADICASAHFDLGDHVAAELWIDRAARWRSKAGLEYLDRSHNLLKASIELSRNNRSGAIAILTATMDNQVTPITPRERLAACVIWCRLFLLNKNIEFLAATVDEMGRLLEQSRTFVYQDGYVRAYVEGLSALNRDGDAARYKEQYEKVWRRDRAKLVWS